MLSVQIKNMTKRKAFTLFELLVSISIIGILVAVASTSYGAAQQKARDSRRMEDLNNIQKAFEQYYGNNAYNYPGAAGISGLVTTYLGAVPKDPKLGVGYTYSGTTSAYCVCSKLDGSGGNSNTYDCTSFTTNASIYCVKNQQ